MSDPDILALCRAALPGLAWKGDKTGAEAWFHGEVVDCHMSFAGTWQWRHSSQVGFYDTAEEAAAALRAAVVALRDECDRALGESDTRAVDAMLRADAAVRDALPAVEIAKTVGELKLGTLYGEPSCVEEPK